MAVTQLTDVVVPDPFTAYQIEYSVVKTAFYQSGVLKKNAMMAEQLGAGATQFQVPFWRDLPDVEADITNDNPAAMAVPQKLTAGKQTVRKSFLHESWSQMDFAAELAGSSPLEALQNRVQAYWDRQFSKRSTTSLTGIVASNQSITTATW